MSDERRKINKHSTGTVPKTKYRNNSRQQFVDRESLQSLPNNLGTEWSPRSVGVDSNFFRNSGRNLFNTNYMIPMDVSTEDRRQNGSLGFGSNGTITPSQSSSSNSRRDSTGTVPKCDNVSKYPDKKQIEDKLNQIQEYLRITTSLMTSMKTTDDQHLEELEKENITKMICDLKDSEKKLVSMLVSYNGIHDEGPENVTDNICDVTSRKNEFEQLNRELDASKDSQLSLQSLQHKAENKMRNARLIQETLASRGNPSSNSTSNRRDKNLSDQEYDAALRELEEGTKRLNDLRLPGPNNVTNTQEKLIIDEIDALQNQIHVMHNSNEDRNQLIRMLDKRDSELRTQHLELQSKLTELQSKKLQVDQLVNQLQNIEEGEDDDVGCQVRKIVTMKDQLSKLKDMLALVQNTECLVQNGMQEEQAMAVATETYNKAENLLNKDIEKGGCPLSQSHHGEPNHLSLQFDNRVGSGSINDNRNKEVNNKNTRDNQTPTCNGAKPKVSSISEKLALQAELKAKKRELEEIMGKHKASSSNLNHDVGNDSKSEFSCSNSLFDNGSGAWHPLLPVQHNRTGSSDRYSSDECTEGANDYSEIPPSMNQTLLLPCNFSTGNSNKHRGEHNTSFDFVQPQDYDRLSSLNRTPDRNIRGTSAGTAGFSRGPSVSNIEQVTKQNVQKQIELIRSVCDTMLSQQQTNNQPQQQSNVHHLRNNLTPSPIYSEPRRAFASPMSHSMNALDVVNQPMIDNPWYNQNHIAANNADVTTYQHWLATNTLQTQAFMLNTLNQCCQMLWLQQRELAGLRSVVTTLQQSRFEGPQFDNGNSNHLVGSTPIHPEHRVPSNQCSRQNNQNNTAVTAAAANANKTNQVSAACSLPNLNQYNTTPINIDPAVAYSPANHSNLRLPEHPVPAANNINLNEGDHHQINNSLLHGVNSANVNQLPSQIWNGQALNNQVAPGNRANNYWDNFRSYSRQNLLSTKSNDGLQNLAACLVERNNFTDHRPPPPSSHHPYELPKSNSEQQSSHESTPQRSCVKPSIRYTNTNIAVVPPDVLNINQNVVGKNDSGLVLPSGRSQQQHDSHSNNNFDTGLATHLTYPTNNVSGFAVREHSNVEVDTSYRELPRNPQSRSKCRNEGRTDEADLRSKLFEELRENVYKEVVGLISANEARPHFLIQLFRDLQLISSDPLRLKALQSIQVLISQSLNSSQPEIVRQARNLQEIIDQGPPPPPPLGRFSLQSTVWSPTPAAISRNASALENIDMEQQSNNTFYEIVPFLNDHEHETLSHHLLATLKQIITESHSFKEVVKDTIFQKHFSNVLDDVLAVYVGKLLHDVKMPLLQNVRDLLHRELSFMNLIQGTCDSNINDLINSSALLNAAAAAAHGSLLDLQSHAVSNSDFADGDTVAGGVVQQIQNEDLAEADQSHVEDDDAEEEGAVGGFLEVPIEHDVTLANIVNKEESDLGSVIVDFPTSVESESQYQLGLDQVPTRLPTKSKSRSNTPNRDRSSSRQDMDADHF